MDVAPPPATPILLHDFDTLVSTALDPSAPPPTLSLSFPGNTPFPLLPPVEKNLPHRVSGRGRRLLARLKSLVRRPRLRLGASISRAVAPSAVAAARTAVSSLLAGERPLIAGGGAAHSPYAHMLGHAPPSPSPSAPDCRSASAPSSPAAKSSRAARFHVPAPLRPWSVFAYELAHGDPFAKGGVCVVDRSCEALPYPQLQQQLQQPASRRFRSARHRAAQRARGRAVLDNPVFRAAYEAPLEYDQDSPIPTPRVRTRSRSPRRSRALARAGSAASASARPSPRGEPASLAHDRGRVLAPSAYAHTPLSRRPRAGSPFPLQRTGTC